MNPTRFDCPFGNAPGARSRRECEPHDGATQTRNLCASALSAFALRSKQYPQDTARARRSLWQSSETLRVIQEVRNALSQAQGNALGIGPLGAEQLPAQGGALGEQRPPTNAVVHSRISVIP